MNTAELVAEAIRSRRSQLSWRGVPRSSRARRIDRAAPGSRWSEPRLGQWWPGPPHGTLWSRRPVFCLATLPSRSSLPAAPEPRSSPNKRSHEWLGLRQSVAQLHGLRGGRESMENSFDLGIREVSGCYAALAACARASEREVEKRRRHPTSLDG
eukprot:scaffold50475_cov66-Phaeocystis_antarctica.AAC.2